jgi:hypothetical protein
MSASRKIYMLPDMELQGKAWKGNILYADKEYCPKIFLVDEIMTEIPAQKIAAGNHYAYQDAVPPSNTRT